MTHFLKIFPRVIKPLRNLTLLLVVTKAVFMTQLFSSDLLSLWHSSLFSYKLINSLKAEICNICFQFIHFCITKFFWILGLSWKGPIK